MANALYPKWKEELLKVTASAGLSGNTVKTAFLDTGAYTYSAAHDFFNDLTGVYPATRATGGTLNNKSFTDGTFDADNVTFSAFSNGSVSVEGLIIYIDDASADNTSRLVAYLDTSITGLPFTPSGSDVTIQWDAAGIFTL
jgi:hypothetical protein